MIVFRPLQYTVRWLPLPRPSSKVQPCSFSHFLNSLYFIECHYATKMSCCQQEYEAAFLAEGVKPWIAKNKLVDPSEELRINKPQSKKATFQMWPFLLGLWANTECVIMARTTVTAFSFSPTRNSRGTRINKAASLVFRRNNSVLVACLDIQ